MDVLYLLNGPYSILFKSKLFVVCKFILYIFYTYIFIPKLLQNYSTDNRANNSKEFLQLQHQGDRPALRGLANVEVTGQH